ncbi:hypothetical protein [Allosphingosinicella sp.]|jgi:hypothetical protein|uniref:hypothetical protein n=1 Tax=Allosphingosinicella sp. TaxID=2823234 RepID=UPI002F063A62
MKIATSLRFGGLIGAVALLSACQPKVENLDCDEIADEAERIWAKEEQPRKITEIRNPKEVSRTEREARCTGEATWSDNSVGEVNLRAFESENGVMVESGNAPFEDVSGQ